MREQARFVPVLGGIGLLLAAFACRFSPTIDATSQAQTGFLPLTLVAGRTASPPAQQSCQLPAGGPMLPAMDSPPQIVAEIERFLNAGGQPAALAESELPFDITQVDLEADGLLDLVVSWQQRDNGEQQGMALVFNCQGNRYQLVYTSSANAEVGPPVLQAATDLNDEPGDELLISRTICGAHTCSLRLQALVWMDGQLQDRLAGTADDLPGGAVEIATSEAGDPRIVVTSTGINSAGAGPYRPVERQWAWSTDRGQFAVVSEIELPSDYRIHRLHDAERALSAGRIQSAEAGYLEVTTNMNLADWIDPAREQQVLGAYARFKLLALAGASADAAQVSQRLFELQQANGGSAAGGAYVQMGEAYARVFELTGDSSQSCLEARAFAAAHPAEILDPLYFGYANPVLTANDMCLVE